MSRDNKMTDTLGLLAKNKKEFLAILKDAGIDISYSTLNRLIREGEEIPAEKLNQLFMYLKQGDKDITPSAIAFRESLMEGYYALNELVLRRVIIPNDEDRLGTLTKEDKRDLSDQFGIDIEPDLSSEAGLDDFIENDLKVDPKAVKEETEGDGFDFNFDDESTSTEAESSSPENDDDDGFDFNFDDESTSTEAESSSPENDDDDGFDFNFDDGGGKEAESSSPENDDFITSILGDSGGGNAEVPVTSDSFETDLNPDLTDEFDSDHKEI